MVVAGASFGAVHRLPTRARIFNGCIRISPRDPRPGRGPHRSGGVAGDLRLDDDLWVHRLVPHTLRPRKQNHSLLGGFVVLAVRGACTAGHWCSMGSTRLAAFCRGKVLPSFSRRHWPSVADLPISRPLHLAGQVAEWPAHPPDELAVVVTRSLPPRHSHKRHTSHRRRGRSAPRRDHRALRGIALPR